VGGTSLSAPAWAGLLAVVNQGRVAAGRATLNSSTPNETQQALYKLPQTDYNVITSGFNGYNGHAGYNLVTGLGTPVANLLVSDVIAYQGPSTTYAGPMVGFLQDATYTDTGGPVSGGGRTNAITVFDSFTISATGGNSASTRGFDHHGDFAPSSTSLNGSGSAFGQSVVKGLGVTDMGPGGNEGVAALDQVLSEWNRSGAGVAGGIDHRLSGPGNGFPDRLSLGSQPVQSGVAFQWVDVLIGHSATDRSIVVDSLTTGRKKAFGSLIS
jgi:hypothetical protein